MMRYSEVRKFYEETNPIIRSLFELFTALKDVDDDVIENLASELVMMMGGSLADQEELEFNTIQLANDLKEIASRMRNNPDFSEEDLEAGYKEKMPWMFK